MGRDPREITSLAKTLNISSKTSKEMTQKLLIYANSGTKLNIARVADILNKELNKAFKERDKKKLETAIIERENLYAANHKSEIIKLYLGSKINKGLGYVSIKKVLLANCKNEEERKAVISASTINTYLHDKWGIPKDRTRRVPIPAANARRKQNIQS